MTARVTENVVKGGFWYFVGCADGHSRQTASRKVAEAWAALHGEGGSHGEYRTVEEWRALALRTELGTRAYRALERRGR